MLAGRLQVLETMATVLLIEPFYVGSHKQLIDLLESSVPGCEKFTLPGKKWHWKARTSALSLSQVIPKNHQYRTLFASSVLNLAELIALRPDLGTLHKVLYFHENQLVYPIRNEKERDFQYGYNQILSSLVADTVLFNSKYNMDSFLGNVNSFLKIIPDHRPKGVPEILRPKCSVLNFPILFPALKDHSEPGSSPNVSNILGELHDEVKVIDTHTESHHTADNSKPSLQCQISKHYKTGVENITSDKFVNSEIAKEPANSSQVDISKPVCRSVPMEMLEPVDSELNSIYISKEPGNSSQVNCSKPVCSCVPMKQTLESWESSQLIKRGRMSAKQGPLHIVWPHRWEHDKDPDMFFRVILKLQENGQDFNLSVLGETFHHIPAIFEESRSILGEKIIHYGYQSSKDAYYNILRSADCVVSTAKHEFFGVAMLEAVHLGCYPVCPNQLVYPEIFPKECLYNTEAQLYKMLREMCRKPYITRNKHIMVDTNQYSWESLKAEFIKYLKPHEYT